MAAKVFKQNYSALVKMLPMNNAEFRAELCFHMIFCMVIVMQKFSHHP